MELLQKLLELELYQYILIALGLVLLIVATVIVIKKRKPKPKEYDLSGILELLDKRNIKTVDYIRNKIVINFIDVTLFDSNTLLDKGALGINIIGDKIKFYFDGGNERNEYIYNEIKKYIER